MCGDCETPRGDPGEGGGRRRAARFACGRGRRTAEPAHEQRGSFERGRTRRAHPLNILDLLDLLDLFSAPADSLALGSVEVAPARSCVASVLVAQFGCRTRKIMHILRSMFAIYLASIQPSASRTPQTGGLVHATASVTAINRAIAMIVPQRALLHQDRQTCWSSHVSVNSGRCTVC